MPTNKNVLINREQYIGSSEISAILGINKFKTRWELLQEKAGIVEPEEVDNEYTRFGEKFEPLIRGFINETEKDKFVEDTVVEEHDIISNRCNYDGKNKTTALEIKTTSIVHEDIRGYKYYVVQLLWGMMLGNLKKGKLAVYHRESFDEEFDPFKLQIFDINIKDYKDWIEEINLAVEQFRIDLQKLKENPFMSEEDLYPKELVEIGNKLIELEEALLGYKEVQKIYDDFKTHARELMIENGMKTLIINDRIKITNIQDTPDKIVEEEYYDEESFIKENPELHERYHNKLAEYKSKRDIIKKGRKGYLRITLQEEK